MQYFGGFRWSTNLEWRRSIAHEFRASRHVRNDVFVGVCVLSELFVGFANEAGAFGAACLAVFVKEPTDARGLLVDNITVDTPRHHGL